MRETIQTVPAQFRQTAKTQQHQPALRQKEFGIWKDISWAEYYDAARDIGLALWALGLKKGERAAIIGENCPEWVFIDMAIQAAGGVAVGIYTTNSAEQCNYIVNHSESRFLFVENEEQLDKWLAFKDDFPVVEKVIVWDLTGLRNFDDERMLTLTELAEIGQKTAQKSPDRFDALIDAVKPEDLSVFIYTSGTTGPPKGAMLSHRNVSWVADTLGNVNPVDARDEVMSFLPLCHIFERLFSVFIHIRYAYIVNFIESLDTISQNQREVSPTVGYAVPRIWEKYHSMIQIKMADATWLKRTLYNLSKVVGQKYTQQRIIYGNRPAFLLTIGYRIAYYVIFRKLKARLGFERMRMAYSGAAPISPEVLLFFQMIGLNIVEGYGQTEGGGVSTANSDNAFRLGSVGKALPGLELKINDDGEILVKSPGVFMGYFKDEENTAVALQDGWLHSGDVGEIDDDGFLKILDRKKDIIITAGGKNIAPQYIENQLKFSPYINDAVVIGDRRKFLTAIIILDEDNVTRYAQDHKIQFSTYGDLATNPDINKLIDQAVSTVNTNLSRVENIRKFAILPKKLYEEDGDVTPTMKVKRKNIQETYSDLIESMYNV